MMVLRIENLSVGVNGAAGYQPILQGAGLDVPAGSIVALVGGSGSGKTTLGLAVLRLLAPGLQISSGKIVYDGQDLLPLPEAALRRLRGREIGMVFQEPQNAFNPVFRIGDQIEEVLTTHTDLSGPDRQLRVLERLAQVDLPDPRRVAMAYPHQLSGGLRQRAMLAQAIAVHPRLLIADEPTSNLDVTVQARIMDLFKRLRDDLGLAILLITHDLGLVQHFADQVVVLSQGRVVEAGPVVRVLSAPQDPYTRQLLEAL